MKVYVSVELARGWEHWKNTFDSHESARGTAGIKTIVRACERANPNKVHIVMDVPSIEALQEFMNIPENQEVIKNSGAKPDTQVIVPLSD